MANPKIKASQIDIADLQNAGLGGNGLSSAYDTAVWSTTSMAAGDASAATVSLSGSPQPTGTYNVVMGYGAGATLTTGSDNILIGPNIEPSSATTSNEIRIGNRNVSSVDPLFIEMGKMGTDLHLYRFSGVVDGPILRNYHEVVENLIVEGGSPIATVLDASKSKVFEIVLSEENVEIQLTGGYGGSPGTNVGGSPATSVATTITLIVHQTAGSPASGNIIWPANVLWPGGTEPIITTTPGAVDIYTFLTTDGGTTWYGLVAGKAFA